MASSWGLPAQASKSPYLGLKIVGRKETWKEVREWKAAPSRARGWVGGGGGCCVQTTNTSHSPASSLHCPTPETTEAIRGAIE